MMSTGHNGMSRDEWLHAILRSGQVSRIAQHVALVIYHLSDPTTNMARLSTRDLEQITGWGRTAIRHHVDELDYFIRVQWGMGRAKAIFELQGVIAEAVKPLKMVREAATTVATNFDPATNNQQQTATKVATTVNGSNVVARQTATRTGFSEFVVSQTAINACGQPDGHNNRVNDVLVVSQTATNSKIGGGKGGDYFDSEILQKDSLSIVDAHTRARARKDDADFSPPPFIVHPDGSFSGTAFEKFTSIEMASFRSTYAFLQFPAEIVAADQYLAVAFAKDGVEFGSQARIARLHSYLNAQNRKASAEMEAAAGRMRAKDQIPAVDESCWFEDGRLMVANGFRDELLTTVGGDETRLRRTLDKAGIAVGIDLKGAVLKKAVRGHFARNLDWDQSNRQKNGPADTEVTETRAARLERLALAMERKEQIR